MTARPPAPCQHVAPPRAARTLWRPHFPAKASGPSRESASLPQTGALKSQGCFAVRVSSQPGRTRLPVTHTATECGFEPRTVFIYVDGPRAVRIGLCIEAIFRTVVGLRSLSCVSPSLAGH